MPAGLLELERLERAPEAPVRLAGGDRGAPERGGARGNRGGVVRGASAGGAGGVPRERRGGRDATRADASAGRGRRRQARATAGGGVIACAEARGRRARETRIKKSREIAQFPRFRTCDLFEIRLSVCQQRPRLCTTTFEPSFRLAASHSVGLRARRHGERRRRRRRTGARGGDVPGPHARERARAPPPQRRHLPHPILRTSRPTPVSSARLATRPVPARHPAAASLRHPPSRRARRPPPPPPSGQVLRGVRRGRGARRSSRTSTAPWRARSRSASSSSPIAPRAPARACTS